jgi:hypothetical protein
VGDDGELLRREPPVEEDARHGGELLAAVAADDPGLAEERLDGQVGGGHGAGVARGGAAAGLGGARLDRGDLAALADEGGRVLEERVRVLDVLDVEELDARARGRVEGLVEPREHVLDAGLRRVTYREDVREADPLLDRRLHDEDGGRARAGDEVAASLRQLGDGEGEHAGVARGEDADAVRTDEAATHRVHELDEPPLQRGPLGALLAEARRDDHERARPLLPREPLDRLGAGGGGDGEDGEVGLGQIGEVAERADPLHLVLARVEHAELAAEPVVEQVPEDLAARLVDVVRGAHDDDVARSDERVVDHSVVPEPPHESIPRPRRREP